MLSVFSILYFTTVSSDYYSSCQDGDVNLQTDGTPYLFKDDKWFPICGHYFWDNDNGATAFCHKLGYPEGTVRETGHAYSEDSIRVGKCDEGEYLMACTDGSNSYETGGSCSAGNDAGIRITCAEQGGRYSSCHF